MHSPFEWLYKRIMIFTCSLQLCTPLIGRNIYLLLFIRIDPETSWPSRFCKPHNVELSRLSKLINHIVVQIRLKSLASNPYS
jgi:hypothetical protein